MDTKEKLDVKEQILQDMINRQLNADAIVARESRNILTPVVNAYRSHQITAEQYEEIAGEPFAKTIRDWYRWDRLELKRNLARLVTVKRITAEEYETITGESYNGLSG